CVIGLAEVGHFHRARLVPVPGHAGQVPLYRDNVHSASIVGLGLRCLSRGCFYIRPRYRLVLASNARSEAPHSPRAIRYMSDLELGIASFPLLLLLIFLRVP